MLRPGCLLATLAGCIAFGQAQQFRGQFQQNYDVMGPSDPCVEVLNTELKSCDAALFIHTDLTLDNTVKVLGHETLEKICKPECREELNELRAKIIETCKAGDDIILIKGEEFSGQSRILRPLTSGRSLLMILTTEILQLSYSWTSLPTPTTSIVTKTRLSMVSAMNSAVR